MAAAALLCLEAGRLSSESVTLTTYYPAPSGIYSQMTTTGNTYLARDTGKVGVGTMAPSHELDVVGDVGATGNVTTKAVLGVGSYAAAPSGGANGQIYYDTTLNRFQGFQNGSWGNLCGGGAGTLHDGGGNNFSCDPGYHLVEYHYDCHCTNNANWFACVPN